MHILGRREHAGERNPSVVGVDGKWIVVGQSFIGYRGLDLYD